VYRTEVFFLSELQAGHGEKEGIIIADVPPEA
jgi:hypothetical protein